MTDVSLRLMVQCCFDGIVINAFSYKYSATVNPFMSHNDMVGYNILKKLNK